MFGTRWRLFRLMGIPISIDASWLIILALLTWTLINFFQEEVPGQATPTYWVMGFGAALVFFGSLILHELGHATVARSAGIPIRGITLFLFGGVAEIEDEPRSAKSEFLMAIAGPIVSAVLALLFWLVSTAVAEPAFAFPLKYLAAINLAVLIFNLVPAFPLDGGRVLRAALWGIFGNLRRATYWASQAGQAFGWLLVALGVLNFFAGHVFNGIWLGLIGLFLNNAARGSYQGLLVRQALSGEPVSRFMSREPIVVPPALDLRDWVENYVYRYHHKLFPVTSNGHVDGVITTQALARFPKDEWTRHTVAEAMRQDVQAISVSSTTDALQALSEMQRSGASRLLVVDNDRLVGIVSLKDLLYFLNLKLELEDVGD